jgi:YesN/AraC family two-component response regulator
MTMNEHTKQELFSLPKEFPLTVYHAWIPTKGLSVMHWHECLELDYIVSGTGTYSISNVQYDIEPGQIFVINNHELHRIQSEDLELICVIFEPGLIWNNAQIDYDYLQSFFDRNVNFQNMIEADHQLALTIRDLIEEIDHEVQEKDEGYQLMVKSSLMRILALLNRHFKLGGQIGKETSERQRKFDRIREVVNYIDEHFTENLELETLAAMVFMNPVYFSGFFKKAMKMTLTEYIISLRINHATVLLRESKLGVTEISLQSGFPTPAYFSRAFRKALGLSPLQYRRIHQTAAAGGHED